MSSTSQLVIGIDKPIYVECQLLQNLPELLTNPVAHDEVVHTEFDQRTGVTSTLGVSMYWRIECAWDYGSKGMLNHKVERFLKWIAWLDARDKELFPEFGQEHGCIYGIVRIGETDDDQQQWGSPYAFEIYREIVISAPI